jgi:hypothetical protein
MWYDGRAYYNWVLITSRRLLEAGEANCQFLTSNKGFSMGAETFVNVANGDSAKQAFSEAVKEAQYDYGHAGYTGTIAEKDSFVMISCPDGIDPFKFAEQLINEGDERIDDKWGPAGCIDCKNGKYVFFGWASS